MPKRILIVDDSLPIRAATRRFLEDNSELEVGEAVDGLDALEKVSLLNPDLIVLDLAMPRMDGIQAARKLRERQVRVPIILFTMHAAAVRTEDLSAAGINAVVAKTDLIALQTHIETLLVAS